MSGDRGAADATEVVLESVLFLEADLDDMGARLWEASILGEDDLTLGGRNADGGGAGRRGPVGARA